MNKPALTIAFASALGITLRAQAPAELPEYVVKGGQPSVANTAPILGGSLLGTPVSTTVIPSALIADQHQITLREAVENSAGVVSGSGNGVHDFFVIRGIDSLTGSAVMFDGVAEPEASFYNMYNIKEVHVLKGPGSFFFGGNSLAGSVNLVREQPSVNAKPGLDLTFEGGSFSTFGQQVDWQSPGLRLNQFYRRSDGYRDGMESESWGVNPSLLWTGNNQTLTLQVEAARSEATPDAGLPTLGDRIMPLDRKASFQDDDESSEQDSLRAVATYESALGRNLFLRNKTYFTQLEWKSTGSVFAGFIPFFQGMEAQPMTLMRYKPSLDDEQRVIGNETELMKDVSLGRTTHHLLGGVELARFTDEYTLDTNPGDSINVFTGQRSPGFLPPLPRSVGDATSDVYSLYGADRIEIPGAFSLVIGGRADWLQFEDDAQRTSRDDEEFSPFAGLSVALTPQIQLFADVGEGFAPPSTLTQGPRREAETSQQVEAGLKFTNAQGNWNGQLAAFQIDRENIAIPDATGITRQNGDQSSQGVELELSGKLTPGTLVTAQYSYLESELEHYSEFQGPQPTRFDGATSPFAPENTARLWLKQDLGEGLAVGVGVRHTGEQFIHADNRLELEATTTLDAGLFYTQKTWDLAVNFENVTDEEVYSRGVSSTSVRPEDGFGVFGTLRVKLQ